MSKILSGKSTEMPPEAKEVNYTISDIESGKPLTDLSAQKKEYGHWSAPTEPDMLLSAYPERYAQYNGLNLYDYGKKSTPKVQATMSSTDIQAIIDSFD